MWFTRLFKQPDQRQRLLSILQRIRKQIAAAEKMSSEAADDAALHKASSRLAELRDLLDQTEALLTEDQP